MIACYYQTPREDILTPKKIEKYRFLNSLTIVYKTDKSLIDDMMCYLLVKKCKIPVVGYDTNEHKFWCKKYDNSICNLHMEIKVTGLAFDLTKVEILPLTGSDTIIRNFVETLDDAMQLYQTSRIL